MGGTLSTAHEWYIFKCPLTFLDRQENILAFGNPGSGKTHLLCAIGQELIMQERRVLFKPCKSDESII